MLTSRNEFSSRNTSKGILRKLKCTRNLELLYKRGSWGKRKNPSHRDLFEKFPHLIYIFTALECFVLLRSSSFSPSRFLFRGNEKEKQNLSDKYGKILHFISTSVCKFPLQATQEFLIKKL